MDTLDTIHDEWFPVASVAALEPVSAVPFQLLDHRYLLLCDRDGSVFVTADTCPHRGAQLSLGTFDGERLQCGYHGWEFAMDGRCVHQPAHPDRNPIASALQPLAIQKQYGLWWACAGTNPRNIPTFAAHEEDGGLAFTLEPAYIQASGPRVVENFLDLAHFPYVHADYLGQVPHTAVERYGVNVIDGELHLTDCVVWQPNPGPMATVGGPVRYDYSVSHPYAATLTKVPSEHDGGELGGFSILLVASPITQTSCLVWRVIKVRNPEADLDEQRAFNLTIFGQDVPIVESQLPKLLPLDPRIEVNQPADAGSLAYRRWLTDRGTKYGTLQRES